MEGSDKVVTAFSRPQIKFFKELISISKYSFMEKVIVSDISHDQTVIVVVDLSKKWLNTCSYDLIPHICDKLHNVKNLDFPITSQAAANNSQHEKCSAEDLFCRHKMADVRARVLSTSKAGAGGGDGGEVLEESEKWAAMCQ